jgi:hypothetical protein
MSREVKRVVIIIIYIILFCLVGYFFYSILKPAPTCFDGKKNQKEEGIDCGGPCSPCAKVIDARPIEVLETAQVVGGPGRFDVVAKINNPNNQFGSPSFTYTFVLKDSSGKELARKSGKDFILPFETKYIIETSIDAETIPQDIDFTITDTQWDEFMNYEKPQLNIYSKRYNLITGGVGYSEAYGLLKNESQFDFNLIKIKVILRDSKGKITALNTTDMRTVNANEQRDFRLLWPTSFPGDVSQIEMEAEADVYGTDNFIKRYLPGGKFQQY